MKKLLLTGILLTSMISPIWAQHVLSTISPTDSTTTSARGSFLKRYIVNYNYEKFNFTKDNWVGRNYFREQNKNMYSVSPLMPVNFSFMSCLFNKGLAIECVETKEYAAIILSPLINNITFTKCRFKSIVMLTDDKVAGASLFQHCSFLDGLNFVQDNFTGSVLFRDCTFKEYGNFSGTTFAATPIFENCQLPQELLFSSTDLSEIKTKIDFSSCRVDSLVANREPDSPEKCLIKIRTSDVDKFILQYDKFIIYSIWDDNPRKDARESLGWSASYEAHTHVYESQIKNCRDAGYTTSAQSWDIAYKEYQNNYNYNRFYFGKLLNWANRYWWNFSYEKWRILWVWMPFFYLLFTTINVLLIKKLVRTTYRDDELGKSFGLSWENISSLKERISFSIFYTAAIYFGLKLKHESINYNNLIGLIYIYFIYIIGVLHITFGVFGYILNT